MLVRIAPGLMSSMDVDKTKAAWAIEVVTEMVEEYLNRIRRTVSEEEMEEGLLAIQRKVGVDLFCPLGIVC